MRSFSDVSRLVLTKNWEHLGLPYMAATLHDSWGRIEGVAARVTGAGRGADGRPTVRVRTCIRPRCI